MLALLDRRSLSPPAYLQLDPAAPPLGEPRPAIEAPLISIAIPTLRRPAGLALAVRSTFRQTGIDPARLELVIIDNDAAPSAQGIAEGLAAEAPFPLHYVHEPTPGVATARNAALAAASGEMIAFLDDDEEATPGWLAALIEAQHRYGADVVFGPVRARTPEHIVQHRQYLQQFFSREGPAEAGVIAHFYGCGDSLIRRAALPHPTCPFNVERNEVGGEDDQLFGVMKQNGARFAWAPEALVYEDPVPGRLTLHYTLARAFAYGQGPSYARLAADPPDWLGLLRWMAIGCAQASVFGAVAAFQWLRRAPHRAFALDQALRGLGKVFFSGPFKRKFYGSSAAS